MTNEENNPKRTKSWGLKVNENFFWRVKQAALEEKCEVVAFSRKGSK